MKTVITINLDFLSQEELERILASCVGKIEAQSRRQPALCTAPESIDQLRDDLGRVIGSVKLLGANHE